MGERESRGMPKTIDPERGDNQCSGDMGRVKRQRRDTFWQQTDESNGEYFDDILYGRSDTYIIDTDALIKKDYKDRERHCWRAYSKNGHKPVKSIRSAPVYRLACVWSVVTQPSFWKSEERKERMRHSIPKLKGKTAEHSRHRCGNDWCCNPCHIRVGSRVQNEVDKHFHYFLNHQSMEVRKSFMDTFKGLCRANEVF